MKISIYMAFAKTARLRRESIHGIHGCSESLAQ